MKDRTETRRVGPYLAIVKLRMCAILLSIPIFLSGCVVPPPFASEEIELVRPVRRLEVRSVVLQNGIAYTVARSSLFIVEVTEQVSAMRDWAKPYALAEVEILSIAKTLAVGEQLALVGGKHYLAFVDLSDMETPEIVSTYRLRGDVNKIALRGNVAYVATAADGLLIFDITNLENPALLHQTWFDKQWLEDSRFPPYTDDFTDVWLGQERAYVRSGAGAQLILDISNVQEPVYIGYYNFSEFPAFDNAIKEGERFGCASYGRSVLSLDLSNRDKPAVSGSIRMPRSVTDVECSGSLILAVSLFQFHIIDASDPHNLREVAHANLGNPEDVAVEGDLVVVADKMRGLQTYDIGPFR